MKKLENQLIDVRKKFKERYYKDHFVNEQLTIPAMH